MFKELCSLFLLSLFLCSFAVNPGGKVKITKQGLDYAANKAIEILEKQLTKTTIPNQSGGNWEVKDIRVTNFVRPTASVDTSPSEGMTIVLSDGAISMEANWKYRLLFIRLSGGVSASSDSLSVAQSIQISENGGKPKLSAGGCSAGLGSFNIRSSGGASWFINILLDLFKGTVRNLLQNKICEGLAQVINDQANNELNTLNLNAKIDGNFVLDYSLVSNVAFGSDFMESSHKARFLADPQSDINAGHFDIPTSQMVSIGLSQEAFNSAGRVIISKNLFRYSFVTKEEVVLDIFSSFRNMTSVRGNVKSISAPKVVISPSGFKIEAEVEGTLSDDSVGSELLKIKLQVTADATASVFGNKVRGGITSLTANPSVLSSVIPNIDSNLLNTLIDEAKPLLLPQINTKLLEGFDLPAVADVQFVNPSINYKSGALIISADVK